MPTIERVLQGDTESFRLLVERYEKSVVRMIRNITAETHSCEDLAQDVFLTAFASLMGLGRVLLTLHLLLSL